MVLKNRWKVESKLVAIVSFCLLLQLMICYPLWLDTYRSYPKIPVFESIEFSFISQIGFLLFGFLLLLLIAINFSKKRHIAGLIFFSLLLFILNDINRLQVWVYQLATMLFLLSFFQKKDPKLLFRTLQLVMICVYFWGGVQKLNVYFVEDTFPWLLEPFGIEGNLFFAYFTALLELFIAFGLAIKKTRQIAFYLAIGMHIFIIIVLSPLGHNWNHVVWPWNFCMLGLLYFLFYKKSNSVFENLQLTSRSFLPFPIIILFFGIMPIFNFFGTWDEQLSFKMYSGISPEGIFYYQDQQTECIPGDVKEKFVHVTPSSKRQSIILDDWAFYNIKVAPYKSKKRIIQLGKKLCQCVKKPELAGLELLEVERWDKTKDRFTNYSCLELLKN